MESYGYLMRRRANATPARMRPRPRPKHAAKPRNNERQRPKHAAKPRNNGVRRPKRAARPKSASAHWRPNCAAWVARHPVRRPHDDIDQKVPMTKKLYIETVGCQMNVLDSELVVGSLRRQG